MLQLALAHELDVVVTAADGRLATMPAKMISEMPLPMPRSVICSPSHIRNAVPEVSVIIGHQPEAPARMVDDRRAARRLDASRARC